MTRKFRHLGRWLALACLCAGLAPGTWLRSEVAGRAVLNTRMEALALTPATRGPFTLLGLWELHGTAENFGGYSAMHVYRDHGIRLFSDKGWLLTVPHPDRPTTAMTLRQLFPVGLPPEELRDIESVTYGPDGRFWIGYENRHTIYRYDLAGGPQGFVEPDYARDWDLNSGIEAMVRLRDGRFIVLKETDGLGFLYPGDPVDGAVPVAFRLDLPEGFLPTDMTQLPDGRVLVLLRRLGWHMPVFESQIGLADPALIDPDRPWPVVPLLRIEGLLPRDNYEAIAVDPVADDGLIIWLAADDNRSALQRSLLAKLRFIPPPVEEPPAESGQ